MSGDDSKSKKTNKRVTSNLSISGLDSGNENESDISSHSDESELGLPSINPLYSTYSYSDDENRSSTSQHDAAQANTPRETSIAYNSNKSDSEQESDDSEDDKRIVSTRTNPEIDRAKNKIETLWNMIPPTHNNSELNKSYIIISKNEVKTNVNLIIDFFIEYASDTGTDIPSFLKSEATSDATSVPNDNDKTTHLFIPKSSIIDIIKNIKKTKESVVNFKKNIDTDMMNSQGGGLDKYLENSHYPPIPQVGGGHSKNVPIHSSTHPTNNHTREKPPKSAKSTRKRRRGTHTK
jgi:hypothetical protein